MCMCVCVYFRVHVSVWLCADINVWDYLRVHVCIAGCLCACMCFVNATKGEEREGEMEAEEKREPTGKGSDTERMSERIKEGERTVVRRPRVTKMAGRKVEHVTRRKGETRAWAAWVMSGAQKCPSGEAGRVQSEG